MPKLAILGYGRAGKDEAGKYLGTHTPLVYSGSTSMVVCPLIAAERGESCEHAWVNRHKERKFWYEWANNYRASDPTRLARASLAQGDMVVGLRDVAELRACKAQGLFDLIIWVDRAGPVDPTVTFKPEDCDVVVLNTGSKAAFYAKLARLMRFANVPVFSEPCKRINLPAWAQEDAPPVDAPPTGTPEFCVFCHDRPQGACPVCGPDHFVTEPTQELEC